MMTNSAPAGLYDYRLLALSALISMLAAYAALDLAERVTAAIGWARLGWLYGGAVVMGAGIWAMHLVGMAAYRLPAPVLYDWPTTLFSLFTAVLACGAALLVLSRPARGPMRAIIGSLFMGEGIAALHYIGIAALRFPARRIYSPALVALSAVLAVVISWAALQLAFFGSKRRGPWRWRKLGAAVTIGMAIPVTFSVGMAAVTFVPDASLNAGLAHALAITPLGLGAISIATVVFLGHVGMISAIDRRFSHQAEQQTANENQLRAIFDSLNEGIVVLDRDLRIVRMNKAVVRFLRSADLLEPLHLPESAQPLPSSGSSPWLQQITGNLELYLPSGEPLPPEQRPSVLALQGTFINDVELRMRNRRTGRNVVCEISTAPIANRAGENVQIIMSYRDVTERRQMDEARARLAAIVESSEDAIIGKDLEGTVRSWNKGAEKVFGYTAGEMIGQPIGRLLPADRQHEEVEILGQIRRGETVDHFETVRQRKDSKLIQVSVTISPVRDTHGSVVGASKIARDITEKKLLERQLRQSQKLEAMGQLAGGIAHDFNNLLAIMVGNLDLLERQVAGDEEALKRVKTAQRAAARGADLTRRMLAFSSWEELRPAPIDLVESIRNTIELAGHALGPEIRIQTHFEPSLPAVYADASVLENALLNLVVNARDAMPKGGSLSIGASLRELEPSFPPVHTGELKGGSYACISITDTGHGMSQETLDRAFEPFYTTKPRDKGTGLGLAMVYGFVKQSGGTVRLYSELGYGTTVSIYLPLAGEPSLTTEEVVPAYHSVERTGTVLVVDDEADLLEIAHAYLAEMGYTVVQAEDGAGALRAVAQSGNIDLMITDVIMPGGMNGLELAQQVRQISPNTKVVFSSGFPADTLAERSGTRVDGPLLHKPYRRAQLAATIQSVMEGTGPRSRSGGHADVGAGI